MSDILLFQTPNGGECTIVNGSVELEEGLGTAVFLSTFGGNELDDGSDAAKPHEWWGNKGEPDESRRYRSELQAALLRLNPIPANLIRYEDAAGRDLQWLLDTKIATFIGVDARMPARNAVQIDLNIEVDGRVFPVSLKWTKGK